MKYTTAALVMLCVFYAAALTSRGVLSRSEPPLRGSDRPPIELQVSAPLATDDGGLPTQRR